MNLLSEESKLTLIESGNYNYYGFKVVSATIDTSSLERCSQGIKWNPTTINKGKVCNYTATLQDKQGSTFTIEDSLIIKDIIETKQTNPSLVLQDIPTNVVAGLDLEIQTSSFLNAQATVMSKVLGCTIYNKKDREKYIHCAIPTIHNYEPIYPTLYMILSDKSIYIGITYRNLYERISEHCTLTKDKSVKPNKSTYDMLAYENAEVYCIGEFHDYTLAEIEAMSDEDKKDFHHKMESVETLMITLAAKHFPHLEIVNRKQMLIHEDKNKEKDKIINHLAKLPFVNVAIDWYLLVQMGFKIPRYTGVKLSGIASIDYEDMQCYVEQGYYDEYVSIITNNKDIGHLSDKYYFEYAMFAFLLLPHSTAKQEKYFFDKLERKMKRLDKQEAKHREYEAMKQLLEECYNNSEEMYVRVKMKKPQVKHKLPTIPQEVVLKSVDDIVNWEEDDDVEVDHSFTKYYNIKKLRSCK